MATPFTRVATLRGSTPRVGRVTLPTTAAARPLAARSRSRVAIPPTASVRSDRDRWVAVEPREPAGRAVQPVRREPGRTGDRAPIGPRRPTSPAPPALSSPSADRSAPCTTRAGCALGTHTIFSTLRDNRGHPGNRSPPGRTGVPDFHNCDGQTRNRRPGPAVRSARNGSDRSPARPGELCADRPEAPTRMLWPHSRRHSRTVVERFAHLPRPPAPRVHPPGRRRHYR